MTIFQKWDATLKIPALFLLMMSMAFIRNQQLMFLLPCITVVVFLLSGIKVSLLLSRLRAPFFLLLFVGLFLMLFSRGETLFKIGPLNFKQDGVIQALNTTVRVLSIITVGIVMVHTTALSGLSGKLKKIMIPSILVDIGVMTGRYIMVIGEDFIKMANSRRLRGYVPNRSISQMFRVIVPTAATLLLRGFDQSEMVFNAMQMRGYGNNLKNSTQDKPSWQSMLMFLLTITLSIALTIMEITVES